MTNKTKRYEDTGFNEARENIGERKTIKPFPTFCDVIGKGGKPGKLPKSKKDKGFLKAIDVAEGSKEVPWFPAKVKKPVAKPVKQDKVVTELFEKGFPEGRISNAYPKKR
jgi:hypothetical protein